MKKTMKCGVYYGVKDVGIEEFPVPQIGPADVLVKVLRAGICGSDTGAYNHGGLPYGIFPGMPFGHEMVGRIVEKGTDVGADLKVGDLVFVEPCQAKRSGMMMTDMCGAFCEYVDVQNARRDVNLYVLDPDIDLDTAALIEPVSVGTKGAVVGGVSADDNVVVLGAGTIGQAAAAALVARGIKNVIVMDRNDWKLDISKAIGAKTINSNTEDVRAKLVEYCGQAPREETDFSLLDPKILKTLKEMTKSGMTNVSAALPDVDLFVDCAGAPAMLEAAFGFCRPHTKYSIVSVYGGNLSLPGGLFVTNQPLIYGSKAYDHEIITEVIDHLTKHKTCIEKIITRKYPIFQFKEAMEAASDKKYKNLKVLIDYEME